MIGHQCWLRVVAAPIAAVKSVVLRYRVQVCPPSIFDPSKVQTSITLGAMPVRILINLRTRLHRNHHQNRTHE